MADRFRIREPGTSQQTSVLQPGEITGATRQVSTRVWRYAIPDRSTDMNTHNEYLVRTYIADRHREAQRRLPRRHRDSSRQAVRRTRPSFPYRVPS